MRSGDPQLAKASKTWSAKNASWNLPVQRSVDIAPAPSTDGLSLNSAPASLKIGPIADRQQYLDGDFNTGNGGVWPKGNVKY